MPKDYPLKNLFDRFEDNLNALVKNNMQKDYNKLLDTDSKISAKK